MYRCEKENAKITHCSAECWVGLIYRCQYEHGLWLTRAPEWNQTDKGYSFSSSATHRLPKVWSQGFFTQVQMNMKYFKNRLASSVDSYLQNLKIGTPDMAWFQPNGIHLQEPIVATRSQGMEESLCSRLVRTKRRWRSCQGGLTPSLPYQYKV